MNIRMLPPTNIQDQTLTVNGRNYSGQPGAALDVPDFDAQQLQANGWTWVAPSGASSERPTSAQGLYPASVGAQFFDTTLNALIIFDGATWRNPATGAAV